MQFINEEKEVKNCIVCELFLHAERKENRAKVKVSKLLNKN